MREEMREASSSIWRTMPLNEIHAQLAVKKIHEQIDKAIGNITASSVARTRPIK